MPRIESEVIVNLNIEKAFALSQTYGEIRYLWDPFVKEQNLLDGANKAGKGVRTRTKSKHGLVMISEYITYKPPSHVGMKMVKGPIFFASFSGGWNFSEISQTQTKAVWRYNFVSKPKLFSKIIDALGIKILKKDIDQRLEAFKQACENDSIVKRLN